MEDELAIKAFAGALILMFICIIGSVYFIFKNMDKKMQYALSLHPEDARKKYAHLMPATPLLYSIKTKQQHVIRNQDNIQVATIELPIAKKNLFRVIVISDKRYECYRQAGMSHDKIHLYNAGENPDNGTPILTFQAKIKNEYYSREGEEIYKRDIFQRQPGKGWPIYTSDQVVAYVEALYPAMKANAFLFHELKTVHLVEQIFMIAMSDRSSF